MKIIKNYLYNASYQLLLLILPIVTAPYVSRTIGPKGVGQYSFTYSIITWFVMITNIGIAYYGDRQIAYVRNDHYKLSKTFWELQSLKFIISIISIFFFIAFVYTYKRYTLLLWLQAINILASMIDISWFYVGLEDFKITVTRNTLVKISSLIAIFLFIHNSNDTWLYTLILALSTLLGNFTLWPRLRKILIPVKLKALHPYQHLRESILLFFPTIAPMIYLTLSKTILGILDGSTATGFYTNADTLIKTTLAVVTATGTVILPKAANEYAKGKSENIKKMLYTSFDFVSFLAFPMAFGIAAISLKLSVFFYGKGFAPVGPVMMIESIVIVAIAWSNAIGIQYLLPTNQTFKYTKSLIISTIFSIVASFPMIYFWGLPGAMLTTVFSEVLVTVYQLFTVRHEIKLGRLFINVPKFMISSMVMFIIVFCMNLYWEFNFITMIVEVLIGIVSYLLMIFITRPTIINKVKIMFKSIKL